MIEYRGNDTPLLFALLCITMMGSLSCTLLYSSFKKRRVSTCHAVLVLEHGISTPCTVGAPTMCVSTCRYAASMMLINVGSSGCTDAAFCTYV